MMDVAKWRDSTFNVVGSHHYQLRVIHILQNIFQKGKSMRTASLNCHYFTLMANKRDTLQINTLGRQVFPGQLKLFMRSFELATQEKFAYLSLDWCPRSEKILSVTHQHSSRRVENCISSHKMKQDEKHHLILFFNGCTQTTICTSFKDHDQAIIEIIYSAVQGVCTISEANTSILSKHKHFIWRLITKRSTLSQRKQNCC